MDIIQNEKEENVRIFEMNLLIECFLTFFFFFLKQRNSFPTLLSPLLPKKGMCASGKYLFWKTEMGSSVSAPKLIWES